MGIFDYLLSFTLILNVEWISRSFFYFTIGQEIFGYNWLEIQEMDDNDAIIRLAWKDILNKKL